METRARPTSRGLPPAARWATLPCPGGQGALPVCVFDAVCPAGKGASELARRIMACRGKKRGFGTFCPSGDFPGAPGNGLLPARGGVFPARRYPYALTMSLSAQETEIRAISQSERTLPPTKPSTFIHPWQTRPVTSRVSSPPHFAANIQRTPKPSVPRPQKAISPSFPSPPHPPNHPAGRTAGSARTRSRVQTLENPFLGSGSRFPAPPSPNAAGGKSLLVDLPPCTRSAAEAETKRSKSAPCSWGGLA